VCVDTDKPWCAGERRLSEAQLSICRRASAIECELESMEGRTAASQAIDIGVYARLTGVLARLLELVGIRRLTKPIDPTGALAKALEAYPATAIDDSDEDEPMPIEEAAEPTNGGLSQARIKLIQLNPALFIFEETREETR
jgi:hypothetical protein